MCVALFNIPFGRMQCLCLFVTRVVLCLAVYSTMNMFWLLVLMVFCNGLFMRTSTTSVSTRPNVVNIGAILSFNSSIGKVAKVAIETAIKDVNDNPAILNGTTLKIALQDSKLSSGFLGIVEGTLILCNISFFCPFTNFHSFLDTQVKELCCNFWTKIRLLFLFYSLAFYGE